VRTVIACIAVLGVAAPARADDEPEELDDNALQIHAFVSQGFLKSTHNNYLANSKSGSFEFFEAGINFQKQLTERLRVGLQLFSRDLGPLGDYKTKLDWAYLDYHWRDALGFRAGRIKLPFGLYNDTSDIDAAHPTALLPQSVYPAQNRDFLLAQTGVELYGYRNFGRPGALDYRAYAGTIFIDLGSQPPGSPFAVADLTIPYVVGGRVMWEPPTEGLRIGASVQRLRLDMNVLDLRDPAMPVPVTATIPATLAVASVEYTVDDVLFAAEYSRWYTSVASSNPMVIPEGDQTAERAYWLAAYRPRPWLQPSVYYALYYPQIHHATGVSARSHDAAAAIRFDLTSYWSLKFEAHYMRGTAGLSTTLNPGFTLDQLADHWALFVVKTTAYF
jgi:hypothetical protein